MDAVGNKTFVINYRMSVEIKAKTEEEAKNIFENTQLEKLKPEYVEQMSIEEKNKI